MNEECQKLIDFSNACICPGCWNPYVMEMIHLHKKFRSQFIQCCDECFEELKVPLLNSGFEIVDRRQI